MKMTTPIPDSIITPETVDTRLGKLNFFDGFPDDATSEKIYDNLDFLHGVEAFLTAMPGASGEAMRDGLAGRAPTTIRPSLFSKRSWTRFAVLDRQYRKHLQSQWVDTKAGPMVIETPPKILGMVDDHWFRLCRRFGNAGPDKGKGGKYLFLAAGLPGRHTERLFRASNRLPTEIGSLRGASLVNGDPNRRSKTLKKYAKALSAGASRRNRQPGRFTNVRA